MSAPRPPRTIAALGVAAFGLVVGHWLAYAIEAPGAAERSQLLRHTGHGYLPYLTQVAVLALTAGLAALFVARLSRRGARTGFARDAARLAFVQVVAFVAMEVGERLLSGASLHDLAHGPLLAIGIGVQLLVALAGASILRLTERAADGAAAAREAALPPWSAPSVATVPAFLPQTPRRRGLRAATSRAPPSPA
jgi:hypothetical protein